MLKKIKKTKNRIFSNVSEQTYYIILDDEKTSLIFKKALK